MVEDAYTNAPGNVVDASSTTLDLAASWGLAKAGTLRLDASCPATVTLSENVGGGLVPMSLPYEWHGGANGDGRIEFSVSLDDKTASGDIGEVSFMFTSDDGSENLYERATLKAARLRVVADAQWPSNKTRHVFGPQETFKIRQTPSGFFTFSKGAHGSATVNGESVTAPNGAEPFTVMATSEYGSTTLSFETIAPTELVAIDCRVGTATDWMERGAVPPESGNIFVGMTTALKILPDHVSFEHLYTEEGICAATGIWGFFRPYWQLIPPHNGRAGALDVIKVKSGNLVGDDLAGYVFSTVDGFELSSGGFMYDIPNYWYVMRKNAIVGEKKQFCKTPCYFVLTDNGDFSVHRFGCSVVRGTNGVSNVITGVQ